MKEYKIAILLFLLAVSTTGFAQKQGEKLDITYLKTTSIVFEYPIINVDRGSKDVIAQKVKGAENTLQLKAARKGFPETNLTVITADGKLHHFYITYADQPPTQTLWVDSTRNVKLKDKINFHDFERKSDWIMNGKKDAAVVKRGKNKIQFSLVGIYISGDDMFYHLRITNKSNINFDVQSLRFFIHDKQKVKRTARQESELEPVYILNEPIKVLGKSSIDAVYALQKFTIPDAKVLDVELFEKNGGRNLKLQIRNQSIVKAERLTN
jgi:conjugative transposon TraN protein